MNSRKIGKIVSIRSNNIIGEIYPNIRNYINTLDETLFVGEIGSYVSIYNFDKVIIGEIVAIDATTDIHEKYYNKPLETKKVILNLVGELKEKESNGDRKTYEFTFGVSRMPLIFSDIYITSKEEIDGIFNIKPENETNYLQLGKSIINDNYNVKADINNFFGSHFAVLGNTGAGKSNTIASIIQTIFNTKNNPNNTNNATFIFIDSNGEYADAWSDLNNNNVKVIQYKVPDDLVNNEPNHNNDICEDKTTSNNKTNEQGNSINKDSNNNQESNSENTSSENNNVESSSENATSENNNHIESNSENTNNENNIQIISNENKIETENLEIPVWALSADDWAVLLQATEKTQLPVLYRAIEFAKIFYSKIIDTNKFKNFIYAKVILNIISSADTSTTKSDKLLYFLSKNFTDEIKLDMLINGTTLQYALSIDYGRFNLNKENNIKIFQDEFKKYIEKISMEQYKELIKNNNVRYDIEQFKEMLELAIMYEGSLNSSRIYEYTSTLLIRLDAFINSNQSKVFTKTNCNTTNAYIKKFITDKNIINIDLSNLDDLSAEIIVKVLSKILLEYLKSLENRASKPINLIVEEAHRYIRNENQYGALNYNIFDRIAKEGRKYGFLMGVSSQRPSDLSKTVLSQCSNFIIHRIQNPEDLHYIGKMVPFINDNMLSQITYIQTGLALVFGSAINVPIIAKFEKAKPATNSHNADIMKCWFEPVKKSL